MPSMETSSTRVSSTTGSSDSCSFTRRSDRRGRTECDAIAARAAHKGCTSGRSGAPPGRSERLWRVTLLHIVTPAEWRTALAAGAIHPTVARVRAPVGPRAGGGRRRTATTPAARTSTCWSSTPRGSPVEIRWEESEPPMRFPHAYGPVPTAAVLDVLPYRPGPDGAFGTPALPPMDAGGAGRAPARLDRAADGDRRGARRGRGGAAHRARAVLLPAQRRCSSTSRWTPRPSSPRPTGRSSGWTTAAAVLLGDALADTAIELGRRGWTVDAQAGMTARTGGDRRRVGSSRSTSPPSARSGTPTWRQDLPGRRRRA